MKLKVYSPIKNAEEQQEKKKAYFNNKADTDIHEWWEFWLSNEKLMQLL